METYKIASSILSFKEAQFKEEMGNEIVKKILEERKSQAVSLIEMIRQLPIIFQLGRGKVDILA